MQANLSTKMTDLDQTMGTSNFKSGMTWKMEAEPASRTTSESRSSNKVRKNATCKSGAVAGKTKEVYQKVENMDEVKSRSEPQKKPQVRYELCQPQVRLGNS